MWRSTYLGPLGCVLATAHLPSVPITPRREPSKKALQAVTELRATRLGVDHSRSLWAWDQSLGSVDFVSPEGERKSLVLPQLALAAAVDADSRWGIAALSEAGTRIDVFPPKGGPPISISVPNEVSTLCWLGSDRLAVTPRRTANRVEVWSFPAGKLLSAFGSADPVELKPGLVTPRASFAHLDSAGDLVYLEGTTGDLQVFDAKGRILRSVKLPLPERAHAISGRLAADAADARARNIIHSVIYITWDGFSLDDHGNAWVVHDVDHNAGRVNFIRVSRSGRTDRIALADAGCTSYRFVLWGSSILLNRDPKNPLKSCMSIRRVP